MSNNSCEIKNCDADANCSENLILYSSSLYVFVKIAENQRIAAFYHKHTH